MKYILLSAVWPLATRFVEAASAAPETCDPSAIQACLDRFELRFAECGEGDTYCQCTAVLQKGASCYAACPQEAMTTFIKTYSDGMCATFDPHMSARSADDGNSPLDVEAARIKSWLGIDVLEDHDAPYKLSDFQKPRSRGVEDENINTGDVRGDEKVLAADVPSDNKAEKKTKKAIKKNRNRKGWFSKANTTTATASETGSETRKQESTSVTITLPTGVEESTLSWISSRGGTNKQISVPEEKALTVTAAEPTTTASLSPQEYQSRLEKERAKANLRSIRSEKRRISSEQEEKRRLANSRLAAATAPVEREETVEATSIATATSSVASSQKSDKKKEHSSGADSSRFGIAPIYTLMVLAIAVVVAM